MAGRWTARAAVVAVVACLGWYGPAAAETAGGTTLTVSGTVVQVEEESGTRETTPLVEVGDRLYDLPSDVQVDAPTGTGVTVTLTADQPMSQTDALAATSDGSGRAAVTDVDVNGSGQTTGDQTTAGTVAGQHTVTVLPVTWTGAADPSTAELTALANTSATYWSTQSNGTLRWSVVVRPAATIAAPSGCDYTAILNAALAANSLASPSGTSHVVVYFPYYGSCGWAGLASIGGGLIWDNGYLLSDVLSHEFGHNLGLGHANTLGCGGTGLTFPISSCASREYADYTDVMGGALTQATGTLDVGLADSLGLAQVETVSTTDRSSIVELAPVTQVTGLRGLRIPVPGVGNVYLEYRPAVAPDTRVPGWAGVQVRLITVPSSYPVSWLIDTGSGGAYSRPQLAVGETWQVPGTDTAVVVESLGATAAVRVIPSMTAQVNSYVSRVYEQLFDRSPDAVGLAGWTSSLLAGTPRAAVAQGITDSDEYRTGLIDQAYQEYLARDSDPTGQGAWLTAMRAGLPIDRLESGFLASDESFAAAGGTEDAWVRQLYRTVLGRDGADGEVAASRPSTVR